jgi:hypothetical protein
MMNIHAVYELNVESGSPEVASHIKEAQRPGPEVISGKVVNPRVDKNQRGVHKSSFCILSRKVENPRTKIT